MRHGRLIMILSIVIYFLTRPVSPAFGNGLVEILESKVSYTFGVKIEFKARLQSSKPVEKVEVIYSPLDSSFSFVGLADFTDGNILFIHEADNAAGTIPVFSPVKYRFQITFQDGQTALSDFYSFVYKDNRFEWQTLEEQPFRIFWVEGDLAFGQAVLDSAKSGLRNIHTLLDFPELEALDIYVYARDSDFQSAINLSEFPLVAGKSVPEYGLVMVTLPAGPAQSLDIQNKVPHEIMHVMIYEKLGDRYQNIPAWLSEGLATLAQTDQNLFHEELQSAVESNSLLAMESLCSSFSKHQFEFYLSYAQAESFTRYLYENYGRSQMVDLLDHYADGVECTRAPQVVYGQSLARLEERWYRDLVGVTDWWGNLEPLIPWLVFLAAVLFVPLVLVTGVLRHKPQEPPSQNSPKGR
jgi:Peptidase MA superfamily